MGPSAATTPPAVGARIDTPLDAGTIDRYRRAQPYPHAVFDGFLDPAVARELLAEFPPVEADTWTNYTHVNERKFGRSDRAY